MTKNLVIVESPSKAKTIEKFLGKEYTVTSCFGHVRDLAKGQLSIDVEQGFEPRYVVSEDKQKIVQGLKKAVSQSDMVWLASDEDREGEAIAWHLKETLQLHDEKTKRIVFNEITKTAILNAVENPRSIDINLVNAQQARRILDRIVGYEISPILWKKIKPSLSAGRVQSVAVRLIVEREEEIKNFVATFDYKVTAVFYLPDNQQTLEAELSKRFKTKEEAHQFLQDISDATFKVEGIEKKPGKKTPAPPFTTSTLQQEASRKLGFSVSKTMQVAQQLYEGGYITYMRTDSVQLSDLALGMAKKVITETYGEEYVKTRQYATKSKGAQEAHEAIRPTYIETQTLKGKVDTSQQKLYELIRKRTIASQMADAKLEKTVVDISVSTVEEKFQAMGEIVLFDGFLKVYLESTDDENEDESKDLLPPLKKGMELKRGLVKAIQMYAQHPARYTEASLVKKMEELGIGRPSTYAPTISTIQKRDYVVKENREGQKREITTLLLDKTIKSVVQKQNYGAEKNKLFPTDIGVVVNAFLIEYFAEILEYDFTAKVEKEFDGIAQGKKEWRKVLDNFYKPFHKRVEYTIEHSEKAKGERLLGIDPKTGRKVYARIGRFGPIAQIGEASNEEKPLFAALKHDQRIDTINIQEALELFNMPRHLGSFEDAEVTVSIGRYGPYVRHNNKFVSIPETDDPYTIPLERCIELIKIKRANDAEKAAIAKELPKIIGMIDDKEAVVKTGRFGPYLSWNEKNYRLPKTQNPLTLTLEDAQAIVAGKVSTQKSLKTFAEDPDINILNGRYGAYIKYRGKNYRMPKDKTVETITYDDCMNVINGSKK